MNISTNIQYLPRLVFVIGVAVIATALISMDYATKVVPIDAKDEEKKLFCVGQPGSFVCDDSRAICKQHEEEECRQVECGSSSGIFFPCSPKNKIK